MKVKWIIQPPIYMVMLLLLTSCWNSRELNDMAIVTGIGMDKVPNTEEYVVTFQIVNPSATATSVGVSTGQPPITVYTSTDRTLFGALRKTSKKVARQLFFAHTQLLVIGESLAKSGINGIFDVFERSHELRLNSIVIVSRETDASSVLKILLPIESIPALAVVKKNKNTAKLWGENRAISVFELINSITGEGEPVISGVRIFGDLVKGRKKTYLEQSEVEAVISVSGLAVFKEGKLKGWLDGPEARGTLWVQNKIEQTSINIDSEKKQDSIAIDISHSKTKVKVKLREGVPVFHIYIDEEGSVIESQDFVDLSKRKELQKLEVELAKKTKEEVVKSLQAAQSMGCDIFNFGDELKRKDPKAWETVKNQWSDIFAKGELDVHVQVYIRSTGMRLKPFLPNTD
ncbi:Ger(x)C family spore germination protein [Paenibacillus sp. 19GGS1-52]|uniref:Ger(x)C family spore germination protein n=1 Tax=Paenibacillus sp. 19GGS1-52 TaxID=2758563 RepID=UPI001EFBD54A|nr:Ger(x)C family spore germination protein [Paenibacillus sp. 19GGS1-52]ULO09230.1 Ger(x)C family spore germination protein [Paenibacillus sp. 19GGS1-52]